MEQWYGSLFVVAVPGGAGSPVPTAPPHSHHRNHTAPLGGLHKGGWLAGLGTSVSRAPSHNPWRAALERGQRGLGTRVPALLSAPRLSSLVESPTLLCRLPWVMKRNKGGAAPHAKKWVVVHSDIYTPGVPTCAHHALPNRGFVGKGTHFACVRVPQRVKNY